MLLGSEEGLKILTRAWPSPLPGTSAQTPDSRPQAPIPQQYLTSRASKRTQIPQACPSTSENGTGLQSAPSALQTAGVQPTSPWLGSCSPLELNTLDPSLGSPAPAPPNSGQRCLDRCHCPERCACVQAAAVLSSPLQCELPLCSAATAPRADSNSSYGCLCACPSLTPQARAMCFKSAQGLCTCLKTVLQD